MIEYLGVVAAQGVLGVNALKDMSADVRNIFGGRAKSDENERRQCALVRDDDDYVP